MAINFLNKVDFNQNELDKARLVNEVNDTAAGTPVDGQLYYDTTLNVVKVGEGGAWVSISGDITALSPGTYINIDNAGGPIPTINHDSTTRTNTTSTATPAYGATFTAIDTVTTNTTGHITAVNTKTITIPASDDTTYTLPVTAGSVADPKSGKIVLTDNDGLAISTVTFKGTTGRIACVLDCNNKWGGSATNYYYYYDNDEDNVSGAGYGHICSTENGASALMVGKKTCGTTGNPTCTYADVNRDNIDPADNDNCHCLVGHEHCAGRHQI